MNKTNAMRILDKHHIPYEVFTYEVDESDLSGMHAAKELHLSSEQMFKTLVLKNQKNELMVCCIPVCEELDLKSCANVFHHKSVAMIAVKDLLAYTGYVRGGCSPIAMKKEYPVCIDETALLFDEIYISAGCRGMSLKIASNDLIAFLDARVAPLCKIK